MSRHRYVKEPGREGICIECNQGRSEDIHNLLVWHKAPSGSWVSSLTSTYGQYRCRPSNPYGRSGKASVWWPEVSNDGDWTRIGGSHGVKLTEAKEMCEQHREETGS
jgi:hypothetical protein